MRIVLQAVSIEIEFRDLIPEAQEEYLRAMGIKDEKDVPIGPIAIIDVENEKEVR